MDPHRVLRFRVPVWAWEKIMENCAVDMNFSYGQGEEGDSLAEDLQKALDAVEEVEDRSYESYEEELNTVLALLNVFCIRRPEQQPESFIALAMLQRLERTYQRKEASTDILKHFSGVLLEIWRAADYLMKEAENGNASRSSGPACSEGRDGEIYPRRD